MPQPRLRIGVNALYLIPGGVGGTEIYLRSLLQALGEIDSHNEYFIFVNAETRSGLGVARPNFQTIPMSVQAVFRPGRLLWEQTALPLAARRLRLHVLFNAGFTAPVLAPCPNVTVFHDLQHKRHPEFFRWFDLPFWQAFLYGAAKRSRLLIAVSEETRADLIRYYNIPDARIRVAPHGVDPMFFEIAAERRGSTPEPYFLTVSTVHPHKNLDRLVRAFGRARQQIPGHRLTLAGMRGFHAEVVEQEIQRLGLQDAVQLTGWIPRDSLYKLFRRADACVFPSLFEGFGMPVLEALASGIPTACSGIEPIRSLAGEAAIHFDPQDEEAIRGALLRLIQDRELRQALAEQGPERARQFSWRRSAEATLAALREAAQGG
jgi:glycosyltransferase involved in cell wall biosynthesis